MWIRINYGHGDYYKMEINFKKVKGNQFFSILPEDWRSEIEPLWDKYKVDTGVYILKDNKKTIAGGLVFSTCSPDMLNREEEFQKWISQGYLYIGFLWVDEAYRGKSLGSMWLNELKNRNKHQKYWLTVEEESLVLFYQKNGFILVKELQKGENKEWLLTYSPSY